MNENALTKTKPHYALLDGLRGVAALMVLCYHIFEGFASSPMTQVFNHGYLAVDFFFVLSGFVVSYAYDDRFGKMGIGGFMRRRLIRLHPMVVPGAVVGTIAYLVQGSVRWDGTPVPLGTVLVVTLMTLVLVPALPGTRYDVRGFGEMYPLNGPFWSLFFEYIGNLLYALLIRKFSMRGLRVLAVVSGVLLTLFSVLNLSGWSNLGVGWSLAGYNLPGGALRFIYAFTAGMILARTFRPRRVRGAFWICALLIVALLSVPYVGDAKQMWMNGLYDAFCTVVAFPLLVWLGASGEATDRLSQRTCHFLGELSYPLYTIHYPLMYLFFAWVWSGERSFAEAWPMAIGVVVASVALAWASLKLYEIPVRRLLTKKLLTSGTELER